MKLLFVALVLTAALHEVEPYCTVPEHKAETMMRPKDFGVFAHAYTTPYVYEAAGNFFLYSGHNTDHSTSSEHWAIRQILPDGRMGVLTEQIDAANPYPTKFFYSMAENTFMFVLAESKLYYTYGLESTGKYSGPKEQGNLDQFYEVMFSFKIEDRYFFYGHSTSSRRWFIRELLPGGKTVQDETASGVLPSAYDVQFSFSVEDRVFIYGQCKKTHRWFIRELLPGGNLAEDETSSGYWRHYYGVQFPFYMWGRVFFYGQCEITRVWFVRELLTDGKMGDSDIQTGVWAVYYDYQVPFRMDLYQYIFGQNKESKLWFIAELDFFPCVSNAMSTY